MCAPPEDVFDFLHDPTGLGTHMEKPSIMMLGATMRYDLDNAGGRANRFRDKYDGIVSWDPPLPGRGGGERLPPLRKIWETRGPVGLLVMGPYRMGFRIEPDARLPGGSADRI